MTSRPAAQSGFELIWVNASPTGPTAADASESTQHRITRVQPGQKKLVTRSIPAREQEDDTIVNDLANTIRFHFAKTVSRLHAEIDWSAGTPFVTDIGSTHGTFVARRHAEFGPEGQVIEQDASAQLVQVTGIMKLRHGDLVQFGKALSRDNIHFNPVRCYVRFRDATPPRSSSSIPVAGPASVSSAKPSCSYGLDDASLDSDVINIDAETFHKGASPVDLPLSETSNSTTQRNTLSPRHFEPAEVEIASSDSEQSCVSVDDSESDCHDVVDCSHSDSESSCGCPERHENELFGSGNVSADDSDLPISIDDDDDNDDGKCATSGASASLDEERDSSKMNPDQVNPAICVLRAPSTDVHIEKTEESESPNQESVSVAPTASSTISTDDGSLVTTDGKLKAAAAKESSSEAEDTEMPVADTIVEADQTVEAQLTPSRKRALDTPGSDRASTHDSTGDEGDGSTDSDKSFEASSVSALSSPCTSVSGSPSPPPPAKKRRISDGSHEDRRSQPRPSSRGRRLRVFAGKALYTASLLSIGFFSGSLFTFKSMLNAAAAANANVSDRQ